MKNLVYIIILFFVFQSCAKEDKISGRTWEGYLYEGVEDFEQKEAMSKVVLKFSNDTLCLFSNAIFGSDNDTLILEKETEGNMFSYRNLNGEVFNLNINLYEQPGEEILSVKELPDYYIHLTPTKKDICANKALDFYQNRKVPKETYKYFKGVYQGKADINDAGAGLFFSQSGGIEIKVVFLEDWKLQLCVKSLFFSLFSSSGEPSCNVVDYHIEGEKIILDNSKNNIKELEILDYGKSLMIVNDKFTVNLHQK